MFEKALTKKELAIQLGISPKTLRKYLKLTPGINYEEIKACRIFPFKIAKIIRAYYSD